MPLHSTTIPDELICLILQGVTAVSWRFLLGWAVAQLGSLHFFFRQALELDAIALYSACGINIQDVTLILDSRETQDALSDPRNMRPHLRTRRPRLVALQHKKQKVSRIPFAHKVHRVDGVSLCVQNAQVAREDVQPLLRKPTTNERFVKVRLANTREPLHAGAAMQNTRHRVVPLGHMPASDRAAVGRVDEGLLVQEICHTHTSLRNENKYGRLGSTKLQRRFFLEGVLV
jgi:hypothetical protein